MEIEEKMMTVSGKKKPIVNRNRLYPTSDCLFQDGAQLKTIQDYIINR